ncbi:MAG TPA: hypothetical protein VFP47_18085, partial [Pyrinomonadaceae bacterium]|nr:hypothetical protein [Pyrinomonadaceae bacterium]
RGAIKGSFPVSGQYGQYQYPNWACKFFIDSHLLESKIRKVEAEAEVEQRRQNPSAVSTEP